MDKRRSEGGRSDGTSIRDQARSHVAAANNSVPVTIAQRDGSGRRPRGQRGNASSSGSGQNSGLNAGKTLDQLI